MNDKAMVETVDTNLFESWRTLTSAYGVDVHDGPDMLRFSSGVVHPLCNGIMRINLEEDEAGPRMVNALGVFRERGLPALCWVTPTTRPPDLARILKEEGLVKADEATGMAAELSSLDWETNSPGDLVVERVTSFWKLSSWMDVFCEIFELPLVAREFLAAVMYHAGLGADSPFSHYLLSIDGSPVACSTTFRLGTVAGLYNVGTLPSARGKGIGTISSLAPLKVAERSGCVTAVLHATEMGLPVYQRLGFEKLSTLRAYLLE